MAQERVTGGIGFKAKEWVTQKRVERREKTEEKEFQKWKDLIRRKDAEAYHKMLPPRFTTAIASTPEGDYLTISLDADVSIVFRDRDPNTGKGWRRAVMINGNREVFCLETIQIEGVEERDPHSWRVITDPKERKRALDVEYGRLNSSPLFKPNGSYEWRGRNPNRSDIIQVVALGKARS